MLSGVGVPIITLGFLILGYLSQEQNISFLQLEWYYHLGLLISSILLFRVMFKVSRKFSLFLVSIFTKQ